MKKCCKNCRNFLVCKYYVPFPERGCSDFVKRSSKFVAIHRYLETGFISIIGFSDNKEHLQDIIHSERHFGSNRHFFGIYNNIDFEYVFGNPLCDVKDSCLLNICKNVAEYLSIGEYAMLKKSYYKSQAWFERAKNLCSCGSVIIDNY